MPNAYELLFKFASQGLSELGLGEAAVKKIGDATQYTAAQLKIFDGQIRASVSSGRTYGQALVDLSKQTEKQAGASKQMAKELLDVAKAQDKAAESARRRSEAEVEAAKRAAEAEKKRAEASADAARRRILAEAETDRNRQVNLLAGIAQQSVGVGIPPGGRGALLGLIPGGTTGLVAAGAGAAIALLAKQIVDLTSAAADYGREITNLSTKTGLTVQESQLFGRAAQIAGVNVNSLVTQVRTLSRALAENSDEGRRAKEALRELGLSSDKIAFQPPGQALEAIFSRLSKVSNQFDKERIATTLFGRGGVESLPLANNFGKTLEQARTAAPTISDIDIQKALDYKKQTELLGIEYDALKRTLGVALIPAVTKFTDVLGALLKQIGNAGPTRPEREKDLRFKLNDAETAREQAFSFGTSDEQKVASATVRDLRDQLRSLQAQDTAETRDKFLASERSFSQATNKKQIDQIRASAEGSGFEGQVNGLRRQLRKAQDARDAAEKNNNPILFKTEIGRVVALQNRIKSLEQVKTLTKEIFELEQRASLTGFGAFAGIELQRRKLLEQLSTEVEPAIPNPEARRAELVRRAGAASLVQVQATARELAIKAAQEFVKEEAREDRSSRITPAQARAIENVGGFAPVVPRKVPDLPESVVRALGTTVSDPRSPELPARQLVDLTPRPIANETTEFLTKLQDQIKTGEELRTIRLGDERQETIRKANRAQRVADVQLEPSSSATFEERIAAQAKAAEVALQNRKKLAQDLEDIELGSIDPRLNAEQRLVEFAKIEAAIKKETDSAEEDHALRILEIRKKIADEDTREARRLGGGLFDALKSPQGVRRGLTDFGRQEGLQISKTIFTNAVEAPLKAVLSSAGKLIPQGTADNPNILGKLLRGTPFAASPEITATAANTTATVANTAALADLGTYFQSVFGGTFDTTGIPGASGAGGGSTTTLPAIFGPGSIATPPFLPSGDVPKAGPKIPLTPPLVPLRKGETDPRTVEVKPDPNVKSLDRSTADNTSATNRNTDALGRLTTAIGTNGISTGVPQQTPKVVSDDVGRAKVPVPATAAGRTLDKERTAQEPAQVKTDPAIAGLATATAANTGATQLNTAAIDRLTIGLSTKSLDVPATPKPREESEPRKVPAAAASPQAKSDPAVTGLDRSTTLNTAATDRNTSALDRLTTSLAVKAALGNIAPAIPTVAKIIDQPLEAASSGAAIERQIGTEHKAPAQSAGQIIREVTAPAEQPKPDPAIKTLDRSTGVNTTATDRNTAALDRVTTSLAVKAALGVGGGTAAGQGGGTSLSVPDLSKLVEDAGGISKSGDGGGFGVDSLAMNRLPSGLIDRFTFDQALKALQTGGGSDAGGGTGVFDELGDLFPTGAASGAEDGGSSTNLGGLFGSFGFPGTGTASAGTTAGKGAGGILGGLLGKGGLAGLKIPGLGGTNKGSGIGTEGGVSALGLIGGGLDLFQGIKTGGAKGTAQGIAGGLEIAAVLDPEPISKAVLAIGALTAHVVSGFLGTSPEKREKEIQKEIKLNHFFDPVAINASTSTMGGYADVGRGGFIRSSPNLSPYPSVEEPYADYRNNLFVPGRTLSQFGGTGEPYQNQVGIPGLGGGSAPIVTIPVTITAMDPKSFGEYLKQNPQPLADGMTKALDSHSGFQRLLRQQLGS